MEETTLLAVAAVPTVYMLLTTILSPLIGWVMGWLKQLSSRFLTTVKFEDWSVNASVLTYINKISKRSPYHGQSYSSGHYFVRPLERMATVVFRKLDDDNQVFWIGRKPIWYSATPDSDNDVVKTFMSIRGTIDWDQLVLDSVADVEAHETALKDESVRYKVVYMHGTSQKHPDASGEVPSELHHANEFTGKVPLRWTLDDLGPPQSASALNDLSLSGYLLDVVKEIRFWYKSKKWYEERGVPHRRGYLLHGGPGTGKSSFVRALAEDLDLPVYVFDLSSFDNGEFIESWQRAVAGAPCIALIEDVDAVFHGRDNVVEGGLTFDCLLNCIDGVERSNGLLTVITTNRLEHLDDALGRPTEDGQSTRPGRIDRAVEFLPLDLEGRIKMARRIVRDEDLVVELVKVGEHDSAAQFQERSFRAALARHFERLEVK